MAKLAVSLTPIAISPSAAPHHLELPGLFSVVRAKGKFSAEASAVSYGTTRLLEANKMADLKRSVRVTTWDDRTTYLRLRTGPVIPLCFSQLLLREENIHER